MFGHFTYLGYDMLFTIPLILFLMLRSGASVRKHCFVIAVSTVLLTAYGFLIWPIGLRWGTWQYHPEKMLGVAVFGTHLEDILWWLLTALLFVSFIAVSSECEKDEHSFLRSEVAGFWQSFHFAAAGLRQFNEERNLAIMASNGVGAFIVAVYAHSLLWLALIAFVIFTVLAFEMMNSAVETMFDCLMPYKHPNAKKVKDTMAAASLFVSFGAIAVGITFLCALFFGGR
ncbi:diacylglycerol kinase [Patescibacteria group bacterium]|nr:diacylglycerol kinase [Patescibacteria group bacterium]